MSILLVEVIFSNKLVFELVAKVENVYSLNSLIDTTIQDGSKKERSNNSSQFYRIYFNLILKDNQT